MERPQKPQPHGPARRLASEDSVVLVGLMGAGKSCIGRRLAQRLGRRFVDADTEIERAAGCSIPDIFAEHGEAYFRSGERRVIQRLLQTPGQVIATGGGAFMDPETRAAVAAAGLSVWLRADLDLLVKRTSRRDSRPLLRGGNPREILQRLIHERYPVYALADVTVDAAEGPPEATVERVLESLYPKARKSAPAGTHA
ncbi:shikimate kinase [Algihabitans albus]|uniref:shikimate kinase n=1 Tax=Algihabitans albus TaxID=2164067 RepID=UPI000E5CDAA7|nr:shikimate kinase [Algihabitans albus]